MSIKNQISIINNEIKDKADLIARCRHCWYATKIIKVSR